VQTLTPTALVRVRYDGGHLDGDQASPYRGVRFGDWRAVYRPGGQALTFLDTFGGPAGLPERPPETRLRHSATVDGVLALAEGLGTLLSYRPSIDDWGVASHTALAELRWVALEDRLQVRPSYRLYLQGAADFYRDRYVNRPETYAHYTADKELGDVAGHTGALNVSWTVRTRSFFDWIDRSSRDARYRQIEGYLSKATDLADLERRQRDLERSHQYF
jgi:hypothetical protein